MATQNNVNVNVNVSDNGTTAKATKSVQKLKDVLDGAVKSAASIITGQPGGTTGSRAASTSAATPVSTAKSFATPTGSAKSMHGDDYGTASGMIAGGGARSFAEESKGLGGLVRTYATFAANLFAAAGAFNALKEAAQTDNLVKGLNTIGAASGKDLGTLSKRLVDATDGAISLREAMTATAQASSAGMSSKNIERLAVVAKNASSIMGVSMTDAVNRLSRGITKLEPELLDELGLFTKLGPATEKYALQVGKSVSQLSDFEKRQAFANAVLEEGEQKYNSLSTASSNAYDKLLATAKNTTQQILSTVNTLLEPIAKFLASNPLTVGLGTLAIAGNLIKRAMPDMLGSLSKLKEANAAVAEKQEEFLDTSRKKRAALLAEQVIAQKSVDTSKQIINAKIDEANAAEMAIAKLSESKDRAQKLGKIFGGTDKLDEILGKHGDYAEVTKAQLKSLRDEAAKHADTNKKAAEGYTTLANSIEHMQQAIAKESKAKYTLDSATEKLNSTQAELRKNEEESLKAKNNLAISNAKLTAASILQEKGILSVKEALKAQNDELRKQGATTSQVYSEAGKLIGGYFFGQISKALSALNWLTAAWAAVSLVLDIGSALFSKNAKEMEAFSKAAETSASSAENLAKTVEVLDKKTGAGSFSIAGITALSTAFIEAAQAAETTVDAAKKAEKSLSLSWWDRLGNSILRAFGKDIASKEAKAIGEQLEGMANVLRRTSGGEESLNKIRDALGATSLEADSAADAFSKLDETGKAKLIKTIKDIGSSLDTTSSSLNSFKSALDTAYKAYQEFIQSTALNSPLLKLGTSLQALGSEMLNIFSKTDTSSMLSAMGELASDVSKTAIFGGNFASRMAELKAPLADALEQTSNLRKEQAKITAEIEKQQKVLESIPGPAINPLAKTEAPAKSNELVKAEQTQQELYQRSWKVQERLVDTNNQKTEKTFSTAITTFTEGMADAFKHGAMYISQALGEASTKAALDLAKAQAGGLTGEARAVATGAIAQKEFAIQERLITSNIGIIESQTKLAAIIEESTAQAALDKAEPGTAKQTAQSILDAAKVFKEFVNTKGKGTSQADIESFAVSKGLKKDTLGYAQFTNRALAYGGQLAGQQAALTDVRGKAAAQAETTRQDINKGRQEDEAKLNQLSQQTLSTKLQTLNTLNSISGILSEQSAIEQSNLEKDILQKRQKLELSAIDTEIRNAGKNQEQLDKLKTQREEILTRQKEEQTAQIAQAAQRQLSAELDGINKKYELTRSAGELQKTIALAELDYSSQELALLGSTSEISKEYLVNKQAELDKARLILETNFSIKQAEDSIAQKREEFAKRIAAVGGAQTEQGKSLTQELARQETLSKDTVAGLNAQFDSKSKILEKTRQINEQQEKYNELIAQSNSLADSLKKVFGSLGETIGGSVKAMVAFSVSVDKNAEAQKALEKDKEDAVAKYGKNSKQVLAVDEAIAKQKQKGLTSELDGISEIAGQTKKLFAEKTAGYKVMAAVEKATAIASLALKAQDMAMTIATLPTKIAGGVANLFNQGGFAGFAGAAAFLAIMASLGFSSNAKPPAGFSAEEQQKVQGTGQAYVGGKLVDRAGGVLGDSTAKADALISSVDTLSKEVFGSLGSGSSKIVHELTAIKENTGQTVKALLGQIGMFGSNLSSFGTQEGSSKGSGLVGMLKSLWGGSSTSIKDTGIQVTGALSALANKQGSFQEYENVQQKSSSWFGLSSSTNNFTNLKDLGDRAVQGLSNIFNSVSNVLVESAKVLEGDGSTAIAAIKDFPIELKVSLKGLTGQDAIDAIMAELSTQLNAAAEKAFPYLSSYNKIGEEFYETVARIVKDGETVTTGLAMVGKGITGLGTEAKIAAQQLLIDAVGGVDKFTTGIQYYFDNFLTDEERFRVNFTKLTGTFKQAGLQLPQTKQGYIDLMNSIDAVANPEAFAVVLNNAESYNTLLSEQSTILDKTASKFKDFAASLKDFRDGLLLGANSTLTPLEKYAKAQEDLNTVYSKAMSGDTDAMGKLQGASQTFLDISRGMYASGAQYSSDFSTVMDMLDKAQSFSQSKADTATLQLDALNEQLGYLKNIDGSLAILSGNTPAARGGWRSGITLVGEQGPEFVDFQTPGRVYTADQTAGMFSSPGGNNSQQAVIAELQALRTEVAQLRKEQQQQTGDLITTNYDAAQTLATNIADAVTQSAVDSAWQNRNVSAVK